MNEELNEEWLTLHITRIHGNNLTTSSSVAEWCPREGCFRTEGVCLPDGTGSDIEDNYKSLVVTEPNGNLEEATRKPPEIPPETKTSLEDSEGTKSWE